MSADLRALALQADRARPSGSREDPATVWRALVTGGWVVVDRFDEGGRRYIIARETEGREPLTPRERRALAAAARGESNKVIAYELGVSLTTISTEINRVMGKLGIESRCELIAVFGALARRIARP